MGVLYVLEFISIFLQYDSLTYLLAESLFNNQSFTDADFSDLFDWNTKQLFILVVAHYRTRNNVSLSSFLQELLGSCKKSGPEVDVTMCVLLLALINELGLA